MNGWRGLGLLLVVLGALALRVPQLDQRPMHNDEAVNALKIQNLWERGTYAYDPDEYHGPALFYATLPFLWLSPAQNFDQLSEKTLRLAPVFFGVALILLLWLLRDGLGWPGILFAGVWTALSPAMVFYSRYFIHEMLLVCFTLLFLGAGWRYTRAPRTGWAVLGGVGLGLMFATKETFVLPVGALALASLLVLAWNHWSQKSPWRIRSVWNPKHALAGAVATLVVWVVLFTSFFTHPSGLLDSLRSYVPWLHRAAGHSPHVQPFGYYLERLAFFHQSKGPIWSEGIILILAGVGAVAACTRKGLTEAHVWFARLITLYTLILTLAYSAISYKTPWCMLGFLHGLILLAGLGTVALVQFCKSRPLQIATGMLLGCAAGQLGWQAWRASYVFPTDARNPYVYAQTVPDILRLIQKVEDLSKVHPQGHQMVLQVMAQDSAYWPLPWYLRQFHRVGWWDKVPVDLSAPVLIAETKLEAALDEKSNKAWLMVGIFELRPKVFFELYVQAGLWGRYVETLPRERE